MTRPEDTANVALPDDDHDYLSTACHHGDLVLPDGRTGHGYCQSDTGHAGAKTPGDCKFCGAKCTCPCHKTTTED